MREGVVPTTPNSPPGPFSNPAGQGPGRKGATDPKAQTEASKGRNPDRRCCYLQSRSPFQFITLGVQDDRGLYGWLQAYSPHPDVPRTSRRLLPGTAPLAGSATGLGEEGCCAHVLPQSQYLSQGPSQSASPLAMTTLVLVMGTIRA